MDLSGFVAKLDRIALVSPPSKRARQALAHQIDDFLSSFHMPPTPGPQLEQARHALTQCNLPLTKCVFEQEAGLALDALEHPQLAISPSVAISIIAPKRQLRSVEVQWTSVDHTLPERLLKRMISSLAEIRSDMADIADRYEIHKRKQRELRRILSS
jgi:hypothetical protein